MPTISLPGKRFLQLGRRADVELASSNPIQPSIQTRQPSASTSVYEDPTIKAEDLPAPMRDPFETRGGVGTVFFGGILRDLQEYNPQIADEAWLDTADMMYRSGTPYAVTRCVTLPLLRAQWIIRPGSESARDKEIAQNLSDNLFDGQSVTWRSELNQIMLWQLKYGHAVFEKCWVRNDDGTVKLARLAPRLPRTLYRWYIDPETDEIDRIQQRVWVPDPTGVTGTWHFPVIPAAKCLIFSYDREGNYVKGTSLYRHMYEDWYYGKNMKAINAISIERGGAGIPWFEEPPGAQEADRAYARTVLKQIHVHEQMFGTSPAGWKFSFQETHGGKEALPSIDWHSRQMFLAALATFASDTGGSYAKSSDLSSFFTEGLYAFGFSIAEVFDRYLFREWVDYNYEDVERYPTMQVKGLDRRQIGSWLRGLAPLFQVGALQRDDDTENSMRDWFDLPQLATQPSALPGGDVTVDTESQGEAARVPVTQGEQQTEGANGGAVSTLAKAPAQTGALDDGSASLSEAAVAFAIQQRPPSIDANRWRELVLEEAWRINRGG